MALPSGSVPSAVSLIPAGVDSNFRAWARVTSSEVNFDSAVFSFQVPTQFSLAKAAWLPINVATQTNRGRHAQIIAHQLHL